MSLLPLGLISQGGAAAVGGYDLISTQLIATNTTSVTFSSIPATYKHLQLRATVKTDYGSANDTLLIRMNSDSASNYAYGNLYGNGSSASVLGNGAQTYINGGYVASAGNTASIFSSLIFDIADYSLTTKNKTTRGWLAHPSGNYIMTTSGMWASTSAITSLTLDQVNGTNFIAGTRFSLYGIGG